MQPPPQQTQFANLPGFGQTPNPRLQPAGLVPVRVNAGNNTPTPKTPEQMQKEQYEDWDRKLKELHDKANIEKYERSLSKEVQEARKFLSNGENSKSPTIRKIKDNFRLLGDTMYKIGLAMIATVFAPFGTIIAGFLWLVRKLVINPSPPPEISKRGTLTSQEIEKQKEVMKDPVGAIMKRTNFSAQYHCQLLKNKVRTYERIYGQGSEMHSLATQELQSFMQRHQEDISKNQNEWLPYLTKNLGDPPFEKACINVVLDLGFNRGRELLSTITASDIQALDAKYPQLGMGQLIQGLKNETDPEAFKQKLLSISPEQGQMLLGMCNISKIEELKKDKLAAQFSTWTLPKELVDMAVEQPEEYKKFKETLKTGNFTPQQQALVDRLYLQTRTGNLKELQKRLELSNPIIAAANNRYTDMEIESPEGCIVSSSLEKLMAKYGMSQEVMGQVSEFYNEASKAKLNSGRDLTAQEFNALLSQSGLSEKHLENYKNFSKELHSANGLTETKESGIKVKVASKVKANGEGEDPHTFVHEWGHANKIASHKVSFFGNPDDPMGKKITKNFKALDKEMLNRINSDTTLMQLNDAINAAASPEEEAIAFLTGIGVQNIDANSPEFKALVALMYDSNHDLMNDGRSSPNNLPLIQDRLQRFCAAIMLSDELAPYQRDFYNTYNNLPSETQSLVEYYQDMSIYPLVGGGYETDEHSQIEERIGRFNPIAHLLGDINISPKGNEAVKELKDCLHKGMMDGLIESYIPQDSRKDYDPSKHGSHTHAENYITNFSKALNNIAQIPTPSVFSNEFKNEILNSNNITSKTPHQHKMKQLNQPIPTMMVH